MTCVELLDWPEGATLDGRAPVRFERVRLDSPFVFGGAGRLRVPGVEDEWFARIDEVGSFRESGAFHRVMLGPNLFRCLFGARSVVVAVVEEATPSLRWPVELDAVISSTAPGDAGFDVLADALLERGHPLGARLRGLGEDSSPEDDPWVGALPFLVEHAQLDTTWTRRMVARAVVRGLPSVELLSAQAVTHLVQEVTLVAWGETAVLEGHAIATVDALLLNRLPWLGQLRVHGLARKVGEAVQRAWREGRWRGHVASGCSLDTPRPASLVLVSDAGEVPLVDRTVIPVGVASGASWSTPGSSVRLRHHTAELTVADAGFELNGVRRGRGPLEARLGPWVVPLVPGDRFELGHTRWTLVARGP